MGSSKGSIRWDGVGIIKHCIRYKLRNDVIAGEKLMIYSMLNSHLTSVSLNYLQTEVVLETATSQSIL